MCPRCSLLEAGRARAEAEGHRIKFQEADAENLTFPDASFDVVMSTFGVMFTPNQEKAASELARVCKPGGKIGLANWTPESFIGQLFKTIGKHIPPAPGVKSPGLWGTKTRLEELFAHTAHEIRTTRCEFVFRYRSPAHWMEVFRNYYGPLNKSSVRSMPTSRPPSPRTCWSLSMAATARATARWCCRVSTSK